MVSVGSRPICTIHCAVVGVDDLVAGSAVIDGVVGERSWSGVIRLDRAQVQDVLTQAMKDAGR